MLLRFSRASLVLSAPSSSTCSYQGERFSTCLQERSKRRGCPPTFVPRHLREDLERLLPPQRSELACLQLRTYRDVWQDGDPVVARVLVETDLGFRGTFLAAGAICLVAVALTATVGFLTPDVRAACARDWGGLAPNAGSVPFGEAVRRILRSEAVFSLAMILLFACLFTSMTQFQTTFARSQGLDYPVFYVTYTAAVIFSRFVLASMATRFDARLVVASAVSVMVLAVTALLAVGSSALLYGAASAVLGLGYGLALPSVQAQAVNVSEEAVRPRVLPMAGLMFQAAILGFPLFAGWVIADLSFAALFAVLVSLVLAQAVIGWWRYSATRSAMFLAGPR